MTARDKLYAWIETNRPDLHQQLSAASPASRVSILRKETHLVIGDDDHMHSCAGTILAILQMNKAARLVLDQLHDTPHYGCHNRAPLTTVCAPTCQYTHTAIGQADERCVGCRERQQGQAVECHDKPYIRRESQDYIQPDMQTFTLPIVLNTVAELQAFAAKLADEERKHCAIIANLTAAAGSDEFSNGYNTAALDIEAAIKSRGAP